MSKPLFNTVSIVGVGLIGGSLGLTIKKGKLARLVIGVARRKGTLQKAFHKKAIDLGMLDAAEGVKNADLVILCTPVSTIAVHLQKIAPHLKKGAVVIDVGSSKTLIQKEAKKYLRKNLFVGCHPMAGSEKTGIENATADLFKNSVCFLTARDSRVENFWKQLGARPVFIDAAKHDLLVAGTSHLPHAIAFSLFQTEKKFPQNLPLNPSIRELARLAQSDPELWADIFISNREALLEAIFDFEKKGIHPLKNFLRLGRKADLSRFISLSNKNALL